MIGEVLVNCVFWNFRFVTFILVWAFLSQISVTININCLNHLENTTPKRLIINLNTIYKEKTRMGHTVNNKYMIIWNRKDCPIPYENILTNVKKFKLLFWQIIPIHFTSHIPYTYATQLAIKIYLYKNKLYFIVTGNTFL